MDDRTLQLKAVNIELAESEERFRKLVEALPDAVMVHGNNKILFVNPSCVKLLGAQQPEQLLGKDVLEILHPDYRESVQQCIQLCLDTGTACPAKESVFIALDGSEIQIEAAAIAIPWKGSQAVEVIARDIRQRKLAEEKLREYEKVVEGLEEMIAVVDRDYRYVLTNRAYLNYRALEKDQILGRSVPELLDRELFQTLVKRKLDECFEGKAVAYEMKCPYPTLGERDLSVSYLPIEGPTGIERVACVLRDVTERKRAEDELRRQKEVFQKIFENIPVMIAFFGNDSRIKLANPEWERTIGWTVEEIREQNLDIYVELYPNPQYRQMAQDFAASSGGHADFKVRVRDGRVIDMAADIVHLFDGSRLGIGKDITELKRTEAELRESEARFRLVADSAPVMIWMSGTDKLCTYFNKPWLDFTGRSIDRELGNGWAEGVGREDLQRCLDIYTQSFDRREAFRMEYRLRRHDGEFRWVLDIGVPRFNPDRSFAGYIGSCIDLTDQKRAEEQLRQAQADLARVTRVVAMGELVAAIAHEVNQPLTAIVTNGSFSLRELQGDTPNLDELRTAIAEIVNDGTRASAVISRIRSALMKGTPRRTQLNINQIIQEVINLLHNELNRNQVSLSTDLADDLPLVPGDPVQLQQVLINLVMNAIEALRTFTGKTREIIITSTKNADVVVQVQDSGPGIAPELAGRIFEPFFTTKAEGIGMGLLISRSIIESHGGHLSLEPSYKGALFQFTLPVSYNQHS